MSLIQVGNVIEMFYSTSNGRVNTTALALDSKGVLEDKYYNKDTDRSVLIASLDSYKLAQNSGIDIAYSALGENLLIDYNHYHLKPGSRIKIGDLILEISQKCTLCKSLAKVDDALTKHLKTNRDILATLINNVTIHTKEKIYLLK